ncbi:hypothetical protein F5883DRAFT_237286 [Diaporthe sp. PMI_573]|nr:hypothetical protein F5883DRAFT_237286 [Diaporthaceae sp. PMI_573]
MDWRGIKSRLSSCLVNDIVLATALSTGSKLRPRSSSSRHSHQFNERSFKSISKKTTSHPSHQNKQNLPTQHQHQHQNKASHQHQHQTCPTSSPAPAPGLRGPRLQAAAPRRPTGTRSSATRRPSVLSSRILSMGFIILLVLALARRVARADLRLRMVLGLTGLGKGRLVESARMSRGEVIALRHGTAQHGMAYILGIEIR